jgi:hypothetical protein
MTPLDRVARPLSYPASAVEACIEEINYGFERTSWHAAERRTRKRNFSPKAPVELEGDTAG